MSNLQNVVWVTGFIGHLLLLTILFWRRRAAQVPVFTSLIIANLLRSVILFLIRSNDDAYTKVFVVTSILNSLQLFGVVFEVAWIVFRPLGKWTADTRRSMLLLSLGSLGFAAFMTWLAIPAASDWLNVLLVKMSFFVSVLMSELFLGMVVLSVAAGLPWKSYVARVAQGLGVFSIFSVIVSAAHTRYGTLHRMDVGMVLSSSRMIVYLLCLGFWVVTFWQEAPAPRQLPEEVQEHLRTLQARFAYDLFVVRRWK